MDEEVVGEVPREGGHRFGIYREDGSDRMYGGSRVRLLFIAAIIAVVAFAVLFPMIQYVSRVHSRTTSLPYPELSNRSHVYSSNCSSSFFSFGIDCSNSTHSYPDVVPNTSESQLNSSTLQARISERNDDFVEQLSETPLVMGESRDFSQQRQGRSRWPPAYTPYPYYSVPNPPHTVVKNDEDDENDFLTQETNIFAVPLDPIRESSSDSTRSKIDFTPPPYAFTPYPNFTDSYAQLSPYKVHHNHSNFEEVMKYLRGNETLPEEKVDKEVETKVMRVSGTYIMPLDRRRPGEIIVSEEDTQLLNGHAYLTDPFVRFRPSNPLEINRLIPIKSGTNFGPRFRKPVSFVPTSSMAVQISPPQLHAQTEPSTSGSKDLQRAGSHTVAIYHPPHHSSRPQTQDSTPAKDKPLSVTLDIFPVTMDAEPETSEAPSRSPLLPVRERGRPNPKWKPRPTERPRWRPQVNRPSPKPSPDNHMVVHLNLFPTKRKPYTLLKRNRGEKSTLSTTITSTLLSGGQFLPRSDSLINDKSSEETSPSALPLLHRSSAYITQNMSDVDEGEKSTYPSPTHLMENNNVSDNTEKEGLLFTNESNKTVNYVEPAATEDSMQDNVTHANLYI